MGGGFVKCKVIDDNMRRHLGDFAFYDEAKAQELSSLGLIEVPSEDGEEQAPPARSPSSPPPGAPDYLTRGAGFRDDAVGYRVAWVQDFSKVGGAELSNYEVVRVGESLGYDIIGVTPALFDVRALNQADIVIINNMFEFSGPQLTTIREFLHEKRVPYVKYEHDYRELRRLNISRPLFRDASLVVFISPKHRDEHAASLGWEAVERSICLPLAMNPENYGPVKGVEREEGLTLLPAVKKTDPKVMVEYLEEHPTRKLMLLGQCQAPLPQDRVIYAKRVPPVDMPRVYSRCEFVLHKPRQKWAGERIFFEALLCGCTCIADENVGHRSWIAEWQMETKAGKRVQIAKYLKQAPADFWSAVEGVLRG